MALLPTLPKSLEDLIARGLELRALRETSGYKEFLDALGELRGLNYLDILTLTDRDAIISAVGEARALWKVRSLVDQQIEQGTQLAAELDAQVAALREREAAAQRTFTTRPPPRQHRPFEVATSRGG